jgi:hypothetical protein
VAGLLVAGPTDKPDAATEQIDNGAAMRTFDITSDGKQIVFDRSRENSDVVLIDLAGRPN